MRNRRKINQKSTKNQVKMDQISTKNRPKSSILATKTGVPHWTGSWDDFSGVLGASWRRLGGVLERSWSGLGGLLASLGSALGASWAVLERRRGILEASWSVLKPFKLFRRRFYSQNTVFLSHAILNAIFQLILARFCAQNLISKCRKIIKIY